MTNGSSSFSFVVSLNFIFSSSRSMQRFPQIDETSLNSTRPFRSTDYINSNIEVPIIKSQEQTVGNGRARSCSGGRNKTTSPSIVTRKGSMKKKNFSFVQIKFCFSFIRIRRNLIGYRQTNTKNYTSYRWIIQFNQRKSNWSVELNSISLFSTHFIANFSVLLLVLNELTIPFKTWYVSSTK